MFFVGQKQTVNGDFSGIQVETIDSSKTKATEYEEYVERSINTLNENGEYEELPTQSRGMSKLLYRNPNGLVAGASGNSVLLSEPVSNYEAILIVHNNGTGIVDTCIGKTTYAHEKNIAEQFKFMEKRNKNYYINLYKRWKEEDEKELSKGDIDTYIEATKEKEQMGMLLTKR